MNFHCSRCGHKYVAEFKRNFLGFPKARCTSCGEENLQALTSGYRFIYIAAIIAGGFFTALSLATGEVAAPGVLAIAGVFALVKDHGLRKGPGSSGS